MINYNSIKWIISMGVNSGYDLSDQVRMPIEDIIQRYRNVAQEVEEISGVYISAVIFPSRTIYKEEWGCPAEGEYTYTLSGSCNPAFSDVEKYKQALLELVKKLRIEFRQSTLLLETVPAEVYYDREDA